MNGTLRMSIDGVYASAADGVVSAAGARPTCNSRARERLRALRHARSCAASAGAIRVCADGATCRFRAVARARTIRSIARCAIVALRSASDPLTDFGLRMKTPLRLRVTIIASAFAVYHVFMHLRWAGSGCIQFLGRQHCQFENGANFDAMMDVDLMLTCAWLAGAVMGWLGVVHARRKAG
ncbi:hypothetical protein [Burkholderia dolosa]|uniref:hypothetical protein n=1 Tax=Burkholderia dolosa TaxID=152500 RepID=UPI0003223BEC|nr:hypothetical protein [Burkholderia dolosa]MCC5028427.1 hypothetical protein [Burkholderia dolosa]